MQRAYQSLTDDQSKHSFPVTNSDHFWPRESCHTHELTEDFDSGKSNPNINRKSITILRNRKIDQESILL